VNREVRYRAPVYVTVSGGEITRVVVDDESIELDDDIPADVLDILETGEWPPWEFGL
jgi:hypothetical protein